MRSTIISLSAEQRSHLENIVRSGKSSARVQTRARILLLSDVSTGKKRQVNDVADSLMLCDATVGRIRRRFASDGLEAAILDRPRPGRVPKITGDIEAKLVVLACSSPPEGHAHWTLKLLADQLVELEYVDSVCPATIYKRLKKRSKTLASKGMVHRQALRQVRIQDGGRPGCIPASL